MISTLSAAALLLSSCAASGQGSVAAPLAGPTVTGAVVSAPLVAAPLEASFVRHEVVVEAAAPAADVLAVRAGHLHMADGSIVEDGVLLVRDGLVTAAGADVAVPDGARVVEHDGHVSAGLVAAYSAGYLPRDEANENTRAYLPDGRVVHGFDPELSALEDALEQGVTSLLLAPGTSQVVGGRTAVVKTSGGRVVTPNAHLALSMGAPAASTARTPTSYAGIVSGLDARFADAEGAYAEAKSGNLGLLTYVSARHEVDRALRLFERHELKGALVGPTLAGELAERIRASGCSVVLPNPPLVLDERTHDAMAALFEAQVPFAFWLSDPHEFRASAIVALRAGATRAQALASITSTAADIARVGTSVGKLLRGHDADFVLWSGDPLEFTTSVEAVYVRGELVHTAGHHGDDQ